MKISRIIIIIAIFIAIGFFTPLIYSGLFWKSKNISFNAIDLGLYLKADIQGKTYPFRNWQEPNPKINAQIALVKDIDNDFTFLQKNADLIRPIASISKLMSSLVTRKYILPNQEVEIKSEFLQIDGDSFTELNIGEIIEIKDLEKMLLLSSSNKAGVAIASVLGKEEFVSKMNEEAENLNMIQTRFQEPTGLSMVNQSTAHDLEKLLKKILLDFPEILILSQRPKEEVIIKNGEEIERREIRNINQISQKPYFLEELNMDYLGGKTGFTDEAKETYVGIFSVPSKKEPGIYRRVLVALLYSDFRYQDIETLLRWIDKAFVF